MLRIDVWSDIACPWCWVGKRKLEAALADFAHADEVEVEFHSFELDPSAPKSVDTSQLSYAERLARKYGTTKEEGQGMIDRMTGVGADNGVEMRFDRIRPGNTFDAHRLLHLAHERGLQSALKERFFQAYLGDGEPIGEVEALVRVASEVGLEAKEARAILAADAYAQDVRRDEATAASLGIRGVPYFVFGHKYGLSGAQPVETLLEVLDRAWSETQPVPELVGQGLTCGPDGCA